MLGRFLNLSKSASLKRYTKLAKIAKLTVRYDGSANESMDDAGFRRPA